VAEIEDARPRQRLLADHETRLQHGIGRVLRLVPAGSAASFTKATVSAWRVSLEARGIGSSSIIIRMSAIRKFANEAVDNGLLAPELAQGISRVKSVKSTGIRVGNWLSENWKGDVQ
jgi:site-specific recombinase XerC